MAACTESEVESEKNPEIIVIEDNGAPFQNVWEIYRISLEETLSKFESSTGNKSGIDPELTDYIETGGEVPAVYQVIGSGVDREGLADSWILGVKYDGNSLLLYPESTGWRRAVWPGPLPQDEIDTGAVLMPAEIFEKNALEITPLFEKSDTGRLDVIIADGIYYISPESSGEVSDMKFSAYTGDVIL